jgi:hypothetical protein
MLRSFTLLVWLLGGAPWGGAVPVAQAEESGGGGDGAGEGATDEGTAGEGLSGTCSCRTWAARSFAPGSGVLGLGAALIFAAARRRGAPVARQ